MGPKNAIFDEKGEVLFLDFFLRRIIFFGVHYQKLAPGKICSSKPK